MKRIPTKRRSPSAGALLILFLLICIALSLAGCQNRSRAYMLLTDEKGCKWLGWADSENTELRPLYADGSGKQVCK